MHIWSAGQIKSLLLDSGKLGQSKTSIIKYLEPLENLTRTRVEAYINTHTKKEVYDMYYFKAHSLVVNPMYRTMDEFYNWMANEMN